MALCVDENGLWLSANGMKMQPDWKAEIPRLKRASLKSEMIARACQLGEKPVLVDATAGLGHDSLLMAYLGAQIQLVERHPILFTLLEDSKAQAQHDPFLSQFMDRIQLIFADSASYLQQLDQEEKQLMWSTLTRCSHSEIKINKQLKNKPKSKSRCSFCIYFYPKMEKWIWVIICELAKKVAKRVIVKRPRHAVFSKSRASPSVAGDACRFDAYFQ